MTSSQPGGHKLCFIGTDHDAAIPLSDAESTSVRSLWSSHPWDFSLLHGTWARAERLCRKLHTKREVVGSTDPRSPGKRRPTGKGGRSALSAGKWRSPSIHPRTAAYTRKKRYQLRLFRLLLVQIASTWLDVVCYLDFVPMTRLSCIYVLRG